MVILTNSGFIAFACTAVDDKVKSVFGLASVTLQHRLILFVTVEHALLLLRFFFDSLISTVPSHVAKRLASENDEQVELQNRALHLEVALQAETGGSGGPSR